MPSRQKIRTAVTDLLKIDHPILLAGMGTVSAPKLAAAVTNAGGFGVIGGVSNGPTTSSLLGPRGGLIPMSHRMRIRLRC